MDKEFSCCRVEVDYDLIKSAKTSLKEDNFLLEKKAKLFALLGNLVRLKMVQLFLRYEKMCVCDLSDVLEMNQSPISQHLRKLKDGGILSSKRDGMTIFYSVTPDIKEDLIRIIK